MPPSPTTCLRAGNSPMSFVVLMALGSVATVCAAQLPGWQRDVSHAKIPAGPAKGSIAGAPFVVDRAEVNVLGLNTASGHGKVADKARAYNLILRRGMDFFADQEIMIFFTTDPKRK